MSDQTPAVLTPQQQHLLDGWQQHTYAEFVSKNVEDALATMTDDAYVLMVPVLTGGVGKDAVRDFYANYFIPQVPPDLQPTPISQTIGQDRIVEEAVVSFTHSLAMDWMLPGIAPTGKRIQMVVVSIIQFRDGKIAHEHLYWDHASVLVQLGLLDAATPSVVGAEAARTLLDPANLRPRNRMQG